MVFNLPLPLGRLVWMRRTRLVRLLARLTRPLGRLDRMGVVPRLRRDLIPRLLLLVCHPDHHGPIPLARCAPRTGIEPTSDWQG
jgi:hypothetical protein